MCDLSDSKILQAYTEIEQYEDTNWMLLGYHDTRDVISLYSKGTGGLSEFRTHLSNEVLYGFVRVDDRFILITWISEQVSGVRRARALVHSRGVANLLKSHHAQLTASSIKDLSDSNIRTRLKLGENQVPNRSRPLSMSERKRASMSKRQSRTPTPDQLQQQFQQQQQQLTEEPDSIVEAGETLPSSPQQQTPSSALPSPKQQSSSPAVATEEEEAHEKRLLAEEGKKNAALAAARERARLEEEDRARKAEASTRLRAEQEARAQRVREEEALKQQETLRVQEAERKRLDEEEKSQLKEKQAMQHLIHEADKKNDMLMTGYISVQPQTSPFWRRRFIVVRGKSLIVYRDELTPTPIKIIDLKAVTRLSHIDPEHETFLPNAFVLETQRDGSFQLFADNRSQYQTIFTALQTVVQGK